MTGNNLSIIAMTLLPWLIVALVYTGESLQVSHNAHLETTIGYKVGKDRTEEVEKLMLDKYRIDYGRYIWRNMAEINRINRIEHTFTINETQEKMNSVLTCIRTAFAKIIDSEGCIPFYPYIIIGNILYIRPRETDALIVKKYLILNTNYVLGNRYHNYEVLELNESKAEKKEEETNLNINSKQIESYTIKFASNIAIGIRDGKHYVTIFTELYMSLLDQDINRYRTDNFEDGTISYYKSYFFSFEVINYYENVKSTDAQAEFRPYSLEKMRLAIPEYKNYIKDIETIENHYSFKRRLIELMQSIPILHWIEQKKFFQHLECAEQDRKTMLALFNAVTNDFTNKMPAFFVINGILRDVMELYQSFVKEVRKRLNNDVGPTYVTLNKFEETKRRRLLIYLNEFIEIQYDLEESLSFTFYEDQLRKLRKLFADAISIYKDLPFVANCLIEGIKKLSSSYTFLNKDLLAMINQIIEINDDKNKEDTLKKNARGYAVINDQINFYVSKLSQTLAGNFTYEEWIDELHKIFDDMEKKIEIGKLLQALLKSNEVEKEISRIKDLVDIFFSILRKERLKLPAPAIDEDIGENPYEFTAQVHILISTLQYSYTTIIDKNKVMADIDAESFDYSSLMPTFINGKKYQYELFKQYASLKTYLETTFGTYIATILMDFYEHNGSWCRPNFLLNKDHLAGNYQSETEFHFRNLEKTNFS